MVYSAAKFQQSNTYQYPTDKKIRKLFEVPRYFQTTSEIRSINLFLGRLLPCWILYHAVLYLFIIKWLHMRRVSSREFQCCESIKSLPNVRFSNMKWLRFQTRHIKKCVTGHLTPPPKMGEIKPVVLLISAKGFKSIRKGRAMSHCVLEAKVSFTPRPFYIRSKHWVGLDVPV